MLEVLEDRLVPTLFAPTVPLSGLNGSNGFTLSGQNNNDFAGDVKGVGDLNGDGLDDFAVGAGFADGGGSNRGRVFVIFGKSTGFPTNLSLGNLGSGDGFFLNGEADSDYAGASISAAGDVNHDGFDDLIIGAALANAAGTDRGRAYVIFGTPHSFPSQIDLSSLDGSTGFIINGGADGDQLGSAVAGAGDINGDGKDDLLIGAQKANAGGTDRGQAYLIFGHDMPFSATFNVSSLNGTNGFALNGIANSDYAGAAVAGAGDVNGDGFDDLLIGAFHANLGGTLRGQSYVVFGKNASFGVSFNLSSLTVPNSNGFAFNGSGDNDVAGRSVAGAGDINGDGFDDVVIGAQKAAGGGTKRGQAYVIFGHSGTTFTSPLTPGALDGTNGFALNGISNGDYAGTEVAGVGDVNGDGLDDILVSAPNVAAGGTNRGQAYVLFGRTTASSATLNASALDGSNGFTINGVADGDRLFDVAAAGDVNDDGMADMLISSNQADAGGVDRGESYVVFGRSNLVAVGPDKGAAPLVRVDRPDGTLLRELLPYPVSFTGGVRVAVGDVNNDGQPDVITAPGNGLPAQVRVFDGHTGLPVTTLPNGLFPYGPGFSKGLFIAIGDTNGDGKVEIIVGPSSNAKPIRVFNAAGTRLASFFPFGSTYTGGVKVAAGDVTGGTEAEIIAVRNTSSSQVRVFSGAGVQIGSAFTAFTGAGAFIAVGNVDGTGKAEIIAGAGTGQPATVKIFTAAGTQQGTFTAYAGFTGGVRVAAVDVNADGRDDIVTGPGKGIITRVKVFNAATLTEVTNFLAYDDEYNLGTFVAAG